MLLTPVSKIREVYSFGDLEDSNKAFEAALHAAEPYLSARMRQNSFARLAVTDTYYVDEPTLVQGSALYKTEFFLSRGFLAQMSAMHRSANPTTLDLAGQFNPVTPTLIEMERGVVRDLSWYYNGEFVSINYICGFEADSTDPKMYKQDQVPEWLKEAAVTYAMIFLAGSPTLKEAEIKVDTKALTRTLDHVIAQHQRYAPGALLPL